MYENAKTSDKVLERKIKKRHDTRAAAILESITSTGVKVIEQVKTETDKTNIDSWFFGPRSVVFI
jgi:site-specific recombinase XerD